MNPAAEARRLLELEARRYTDVLMLWYQVGELVLRGLDPEDVLRVHEAAVLEYKRIARRLTLWKSAWGDFFPDT